GMSEHDRLLDLERPAQRTHIFRPSIDGPALRRGMVTSSRAAHAWKNQLGEIGERRQFAFQIRMVTARAAMQGDQRRWLNHLQAVGNELGSDHVEEQTSAVDFYSHRGAIRLFRNRVSE